jgi:hypothetical protein
MDGPSYYRFGADPTHWPQNKAAAEQVCGGFSFRYLSN